MTFAEIMEGVGKKVDSSTLEGTALYQFRITGEGGGDFFVDIREGQGQVQEGLAEEPNVTVTMEKEDFLAMVAGKMNATAAFFSGKIKIKGDMSLAMKLQSFLG